MYGFEARQLQRGMLGMLHEKAVEGVGLGVWGVGNTSSTCQRASHTPTLLYTHTPYSMSGAGDARLGHLPDVERSVDLIVGEQVHLSDDVPNRAAFGGGFLGDL